MTMTPTYVPWTKQEALEYVSKTIEERPAKSIKYLHKYRDELELTDETFETYLEELKNSPGTPMTLLMRRLWHLTLRDEEKARKIFKENTPI
jgi:hypothetical protein